MGPMSVVVPDVDVQHALELRASDDKDPVKALAPHRADEAPGRKRWHAVPGSAS
jgi:hypothetical protein